MTVEPADPERTAHEDIGKYDTYRVGPGPGRTALSGAALGTHGRAVSRTRRG
jgi:hypothetical protein